MEWADVEGKFVDPADARIFYDKVRLIDKMLPKLPWEEEN